MQNQTKTFQYKIFDREVWDLWNKKRFLFNPSFRKSFCLSPLADNLGLGPLAHVLQLGIKKQINMWTENNLLQMDLLIKTYAYFLFFFMVGHLIESRFQINVRWKPCQKVRLGYEEEVDLGEIKDFHQIRMKWMVASVNQLWTQMSKIWTPNTQWWNEMQSISAEQTESSTMPPLHV